MKEKMQKKLSGWRRYRLWIAAGLMVLVIALPYVSIRLADTMTMNPIVS